MERTLIRKINENIGREVNIQGYTDSYLSLKNLRFLFLRDRSGTCQIVIPSTLETRNLGREDIASVTGMVVHNVKSRYNDVELVARTIQLLSRGIRGTTISERNYSTMTLEQRLDRRASTFRTAQGRKTFLFASDFVYQLRKFLHDNDFIEVNTPKIVGAINDGGSEVFRLDYFGKPASLSQSPQLYLQMMLAGFERVYEFSTCFRSERNTTQRHVNEFQSLDLEIAFSTDSAEIMTHLELMLQSTFEKGNFLIPRVSYGEALRILKKNYKYKLSGEDKRRLGSYAKEIGSEFLFVHTPPLQLSQFYAKPIGREYADTFKLLYKGVEVAAGGQRIEDYGELVGAMDRNHMIKENYKDYLEAFRLGIPPHGGFSLGIHRIVALIQGLDNIREAIPFPRDPKRLTP